MMLRFFFLSVFSGTLILLKGVEKLSAVLYHLFFRRRRIKYIKDSDVIFIPELNLYTVPLDIIENQEKIINPNGSSPGVHKSWLVKSIYPELDDYNINLRCLTVDLKQVRSLSEKDRNYECTTVARLNGVIKNLIFDINPKLEQLYQKRDELTRLKNLAASSEIYSSQTGVYERAIVQIQSIIEGAEKFRYDCLKFIRETLIERELVKSQIDPDLLDWKISFDEKSQALQEKYDNWREEVKAYLSLKNGINPKSSSGSLR